MKVLSKLLVTLVVLGSLFVTYAQSDDTNDPVVLYTGPDHVVQSTVVVGTEPQVISLGIITNNTKQPMRFRIQTNQTLDWLRLPEQPEQTTVAPGEVREIRIQVLPAKMRPGQAKAQLNFQLGSKVESDISLDVNRLFEFWVNILEPQTDTCEIKISIISVKVTDGQGVGEGKLELRITGFADDEQGTWPSSQGTQQVKDGQQLAVNKEIGVFTLKEDETRIFSLQTEVLEVDSGFAGADDTGFDTATMEVSCDTVPMEKRVTIDIIGQNDGQVQVTYKAVRID